MNKVKTIYATAFGDIKSAGKMPLVEWNYDENKLSTTIDGNCIVIIPNFKKIMITDISGQDIVHHAYTSENDMKNFVADTIGFHINFPSRFYTNNPYIRNY